MNGTNNLFVGGEFSSIDGNSILVNNIASWNGNAWNILGSNSTNNEVIGLVNDLAMNGTNQLFVGGSFTIVDGSSISANYIASWDGNSWNILGSNSTNNGVDSDIFAFAMNGTNNLFVGGYFTSAGGTSISANYISSWDGNSWNMLGNSTNNGLNSYVYALAMNSSWLFVGGDFSATSDGICSPFITSYSKHKIGSPSYVYFI